jgi:hypothetical protein
LKKLISILLIGTILFNLVGYQLLYYFLENRANTHLEERLDQNSFDQAELISFKVPVERLSYYSSSYQFDRMDGEIEISGMQYRCVKSRLLDDSLEVWCLPNPKAIRLRDAKDEFFMLVSDLEHSGHQKKSSSHPSVPRNTAIDYLVLDAVTLPNYFYQINKNSVFRHEAPLYSAFQYSIDRPPRNG